MEETYKNALAEIYTILEFVPINHIKKLNPQFIKFIENNKNKEYEYKIDVTKKIENQQMLLETKAILSIIYRDYWCSNERKIEMLKQQQNEKEQYEYEIRKKYNPDEIFKNNKDGKIKEDIIENKVSMIEYKESIFKRIIDKIKKYLFKNRLIK